MQSESSEQDSWQPSPTAGSSLFSKKVIQFGNKQIAQNQEQQYSKPIQYPYHSSDEEPEDEHEHDQYRHNHNTKSHPKDAHTPVEALYDPLEDDNNELWLKNQHSNSTHKAQRPLSCPQCFIQVCYIYQTHVTPGEEQLIEYSSTKALECVQPNPRKIIRNTLIGDTMEPVDTLLHADGHPWMIDSYEKQLLNRQNEFNIKIVCQCDCGADLGYYDVNRKLYTLVNVV